MACTGTAGETSGQRASVALVVDDDEASRRACMALLHATGMRVLDAADAPSAFAILCRIPQLDLLVVDWHMQPVNGYSLIRTVRAIPLFRDVPIVLLTAERNRSHHDQARAAGADAVLTKPIDRARFAEVLRRCLPAPIAASPAAAGRWRLAAEIGIGPWTAVVRAFLVSADEALAEIARLIRCGEETNAAKVAHRIAGGALNLEQTSFARALHAIEEAAFSCEREELVALLLDAHAAWRSSSAVLRAAIADLAGEAWH